MCVDSFSSGAYQARKDFLFVIASFSLLFNFLCQQAMHTTTVTNQPSLRSTSSTFVSDKRTKRGHVQERMRLANVPRAIASRESSDNEDDWYDANR